MYCPKCQKDVQVHSKIEEETLTTTTSWVICDECSSYISRRKTGGLGRITTPGDFA